MRRLLCALLLSEPSLAHRDRAVPTHTAHPAFVKTSGLVAFEAAWRANSSGQRWQEAQMMGALVRNIHSQKRSVRDAGAMLLTSATSTSSSVMMDGAAESEASLREGLGFGESLVLAPQYAVSAAQEPH